jgi:hypothetical protein
LPVEQDIAPRESRQIRAFLERGWNGVDCGALVEASEVGRVIPGGVDLGVQEQPIPERLLQLDGC